MDMLVPAKPRSDISSEAALSMRCRESSTATESPVERSIQKRYLRRTQLATIGGEIT
jgi:hypothetical protein